MEGERHGKVAPRDDEGRFIPDRDNITVRDEPERGTSRQYAIRKLRNDAPELHARVLAGELSPHRAIIEAGFRTPTISVPLDPEGAARCLLRHFRGERLDAVLQAVANARGDVQDAAE